MMYLPISVLVALVLNTSLLVRASAQEASPSRADPRRWWIAVGADPYALDLRTRDPGARGELLVMAERDVWRARGGSIGARAVATFGSDLPRGVDVSSDNCRDCEFTYTRQFVSLGVVATKAFMPRPGWSAYVLAGPSAHVARRGGSLSGGTFTYEELGKAPLPQSRTRWSLGMSGGVGLGMPIAGGRLFVEQWLQAPSVISRQQRARDDDLSIPLVVGFRF